VSGHSTLASTCGGLDSRHGPAADRRDRRYERCAVLCSLPKRRRPTESARRTRVLTWQVAYNAAQSKLLCKDALVRAVSERSLAQLAHRQKVPGTPRCRRRSRFALSHVSLFRLALSNSPSPLPSIPLSPLPLSPLPLIPSRLSPSRLALSRLLFPA
jgi:hypothetical protein